jgi:hypothetical protein
MCRSCAEGGRRCKSQQGNAKKQYQAAWVARGRAGDAFDEKFSDRPEAQPVQEGIDPVSDFDAFVAGREPAEVTAAFADTAQIQKLTPMQAHRLGEIAREAVKDLGPRAREVFEQTPDFVSSFEGLVETGFEKYFEEGAEEKYGKLAVFSGRGQHFSFLKSEEYKQKVEEKDEELYGAYERSVRDLGHALSVAAVASFLSMEKIAATDDDVAAEVKSSEKYKVRVLRAQQESDRMHRVVDEEFMRGVLSEKSLQGVSDAYRSRVWISHDEIVAIAQEQVNTLSIGQTWELLNGPGRADARRNILAFRKGLEMAWESRAVEKYLVTKAETVSESDMARVLRGKYNTKMLARYRGEIGRFVKLSGKDTARVREKTVSLAYGKEDIENVVESFSAASMFYPASYLDRTYDNFGEIAFASSGTERASFSRGQMVPVRTSTEESYVVPLSEEFYAGLDMFDKAFQPLVSRDMKQAGAFSISEAEPAEGVRDKYFFPDTPEEMARLNGFVSRYNRKVDDYNSGRSSEDLLFDEKTYFVEGQGDEKIARASVDRVVVDGQEMLAVVTRPERKVKRQRRDVVYVGEYRDESERLAVATHELGHAVEFSVPEIHVATNRFLRRRTLGQKSVQYMNNPDERVVPDGFTNEYVGKQYGDEATEVFTLGMESLIHGRYSFTSSSGDLSAVGGCDDPEHRDVVLGSLLMAGF